MKTTILAYVIAVLGLVMIVTGAWTLFNLFGERDRDSPVLHRDYAMAIAIICIGFAIGGIAQSLRLLLFVFCDPTLIKGVRHAGFFAIKIRGTVNEAVARH